VRGIRFVLSLALAVTVGARCGHAAEKPNILFLVTDDQRADTIAALGNPVIRTPNLDGLVRSGFVFRNAYCMGSTVGAVCNPSRHMLLSGMSLYRYNARKKEGTFADVMNQAGYVTWHTGKKGNTPQVYHQAFQHSDYVMDARERNSGHHGRTEADRAIEFLRTGWDRKNPLCMYLAFAGPHDPRVAAEEWLRLYETDKMPLPKNYRPFHPFDNGDLLIRDEKLAPWPRTEAVVRKHLHDYYACISSIDHHIGRILETLKELRAFENTIVVFSADHGLAIGSHGLFGKQSLYEHSMKSPLILAGPGIAHGNSTAPAYLFDIFPTIADLAGARVPDSLDGASLVPIMQGKKERIRDVVFLAYRDVQRAVRHGDWKLIRYPKVDVTQLFNLRDDPEELNDLSGQPAHAAKVQELMTLLSQQQKHYGDKAPLKVENPTPARVDEEFFKRGSP
jgi:arylsulfatase A-like enzyme